MAKKRISKEAAVPKRPLTPDERQRLAEVRAWTVQRNSRRFLEHKVPERALPDSETLKRPGQLERVFVGIKTRFRMADQRHRECIDQEVMQCVRLARFLNALGPSKSKVLKGRWLKHLGKSDRGPSESLRFVLLQVFEDPKRASFYYRATRALFEEGVEVTGFPARITAGGGYQALAKENVRFPRGTAVPAPEPAGGLSPPHAKGGRTKATPHREGEKPAAPKSNGADRTWRSPKDDGEPDADQPEAMNDGSTVTLVATFAGAGHDFRDLPIPCFAVVGMHLRSAADGTWTVEIYEAESVQPN